jgi:lysyl-tRNA synthetase class 2
MRRDTKPGQHPNGLIEFLVAGTITELRDRGHRGLGLHFATMRAVLAGDLGDRFWQRSITRLMHRLSDDMQIESLWRFNAKFDPLWLPRYLVVDRPQSTLRAGLAIAQLESLWELPLIGHLLHPATDAFAS